MLITVKRLCISLARGTEASVLPIGVAAFIALAALIGGGVDVSRAYMVQSRLQAACDAGSLAGRRAVTTDGFDEHSQQQANDYFDNNFHQSSQAATGTNRSFTSDSSGNVVNGTASTQVPTTIMRIFGFTKIPVSATCTASMGVGNSDVMMVLDTTGSMDDPIGSSGPSKISMLRDAMQSFYNTVVASTSGSNARIRYGFVPYSSSVNVGHLLYDLNPSYVRDSWPIQSKKPVYRTVTVTVVDHYAAPVTTTSTGNSSSTVTAQGDVNATHFTTSNSCNSSLPADTAWTNNGTSSSDTATIINANKQQVTTTTVTQPMTKTTYSCVQRTSGRGRNKTAYYVQTYATYEEDFYNNNIQTADPVYTTVTQNVFDHYSYEQVTYDVSSLKTFSSVATITGPNGTSQSSTWDGCIEERQTTPAASFSFNSLLGITPSGATDLDIDTAPTSSDSTKWAPMWRQVAYYRTTSRGSLTNASTSLYGSALYTTSSYSNYSFCPYRAQLMQEMTSDEFTSYVNNLHAEGATYHDLGILWGARLASPQGIFADNVNEPTSNGAPVSRHMIFMTDGQLDTSNIVQSTYGVELYDKRITTDGSTGLNSRHNSRFLALCEAVKAKGIRLWVIAFDTGLSTDLQTCASDNSAFTANDSAELNAAFQEIAKQVGELRITQ